MGIAYDWVLQKRIIPKKKKRKNDPAYDMSSNYICLGPLTTNMRHWHFSFRGAGEVFGKGIYHGRIVLPKDYPLKPPRVQMWTESGRFKPGADICLSASAYHPESWTPKWTIFGLVNALRLHMLQSPIEIGGIARTREDMLDFAQKSQSWFIEWWSGGSVKIQVSHAKLLKEGILTLDHDGEEELQKQVTDELQSLVNQKNETTISQGIGTEFFAEPGTNGGDVPAVAIRKEHTSSASTAVFVDNAKKKKNSGIKKKKMKHRRVGTVPADRLLQQVEQRKLGKRQVQNHVRLMRLTQSLTDPVTVAFISILILIWLNK
jgi:ubiquitin-protein ligase